ncbi:MAG: AI-2E family transporter [Pseudomonadota bacterium]
MKNTPKSYEKFRESKPYGPHLWQLTAVREAVVIGFLGLGLYMAYQLSVIFSPVVLALLSAYLIHPIVDFFESRFGLQPKWTVALLLSFGFVALTSVGIWIGPLLVEQMKLFVAAQPAYTLVVTEKTNAWLRSVGVGYRVNDFFNLALSETGRFLTAANGFLKSMVDVSLGIMIGLVCFYKFAANSKGTYRYLLRWLPRSLQSEYVSLMDVLNVCFAGFFRGRIIIALITVFFFSYAWKITGVSYWLLFGMLAAFFNIVPYLSLFVWLVALIVNMGDALIKNESLDIMRLFVWPSVAFGVVQFVEGWFLTPWVQGKDEDLSAATVLLAISVGGMAGGFVGLVVSIPLAAAVKMLAESYLVRSKR